MAEGGGDEVGCQPLPEAGGHDYSYVEEPPENLTCPICMLPCREPQIIDCCGAKFCLSCIEREQFAGKPCPLCRVKQFRMLIDKDHKRKILALKVHCINREEGCQWIGELRHIEDPHLKKDCKYVLEECKWPDCRRKYKRKDILFHQEDECPYRPLELVLLKKVEALERQCEVQKESLEEKDRIIKEMKEKMEDDRKDMEAKVANTTKGLETKMADNTKELEQRIATDQEQMTDKINKMEQTITQNDEGYRAEVGAVKEGQEKLHKRIEEEKGEVKREIVKFKEESIRESTHQLNIKIEELKQEVERKLKSELKQFENNKIKPQEEKITKMEKEVTAAGKTAGDLNARVPSMQDGMRKIEKNQREAIERISNIDRQFDTMRKMSLGFKIPEWQRPLPLTSFSNIPPCQFTMMNFTYHKKQGKAWYSPPFYSEPGGYKFCLRIDPNGMLEGKESHLSVWVYVMRGRFDESLKWPFTGKVTVQLLNWKADKGHIQNIVSFDDAAGDKVRARVTSGKYAATGRGSSKFVPHSMLRLNVAKNTEFIVDDCMCFKISKVDIKDISGGYSHTSSLSSSDSFSTSTIVS